MDLEELLALMSTQIYCAHLGVYIEDRRVHPTPVPSKEWKDIVMSLAVAEAKLLWNHVRQEAHKV